jgi:glutathione S-transferase
MPAALYVILGSHACRTGMLLLEHKGIRYRRVELPTGLHPLLLPLLGFAASSSSRRVADRPLPAIAVADRLGTVPALAVDGERVMTNRAIARYLDDVRPEPPLFPADADRRRAVEEAESWGDEVFQMAARRLALAAGPELSAADFVIAPSLALVCYAPDLRSEIERRPALRLLDRVLPRDCYASGDADPRHR